MFVITFWRLFQTSRLVPFYSQTISSVSSSVIRVDNNKGEHVSACKEADLSTPPAFLILGLKGKSVDYQCSSWGERAFPGVMLLPWAAAAEEAAAPSCSPLSMATLTALADTLAQAPHENPSKAKAEELHNLAATAGKSTEAINID